MPEINEIKNYKNFIKIYKLLIEDRARKCAHHDINLYYDDENNRLVIHMINEHGTIYYNDFKSSEIFASSLSDIICFDFLNNHRITLSSLNTKNDVEQIRIQNSYFDIYRNFRKKDINKREAIHLVALNKMNTYNSYPTNFEKNVTVKEPEKIQITRFIELLELILENRALKAENHDIDIYYDKFAKSLVVNITSNGETIYYNDYECSKKIGKLIADSICEDFIENHRITLPSINKTNSVITIQNTYFTIKRKFDEIEIEQMRELKEKAHIKRENGQNEVSQFEKTLIKTSSDR